MVPSSRRVRGRWLAGAVALVFGGGVGAGADGPPPGTVSPLRQWAASVVTIEDVAGRRGPIASGVVVSADGHVATACSILHRMRRVRVRTHEGATHDVLGVAAADRRKDLALLVIERGPDMPPAAPLVDRAVDVGETVHAVAGPAAEPLVAATDRVDAIESGAWYRRSLPVAERGTVAADQCRIIHHAYMNLSARGGALFGDDGRLLGVLVAAADWDDRIHVAVHAGHVHELLDQAVAPRALSTLAQDDPLPDALEPAAAAAARSRHHLPPLAADVAARGRDLRRLLHELLATRDSISREQRRLTARADGWRAEAAVPQQAFESVQQLIAQNRLEFTSMVPEIVGVDRPIGDDLEITERYYSPRQMAMRQQLDRECLVLTLQLARIHGERLRWQSRTLQSDRDRAALERMAESLREEIFFAGDPLGMRGDDEIEEALGVLDAEIAEGGGDGTAALVRGLWLTRLERFVEAMADFDRVIEDDRRLRSAARLARQRALGRLRGAGISAAVASAARSAAADPVIETVLARCAIDAADWPVATRWLQAALVHGGDPVELQIALARASLAPRGGQRNPRRALEQARGACRASRGADWRAFVTEAMALGAAGDWEKAALLLIDVEPLVDAVAWTPFRDWQAAIDREQLPADWFSR